MILEELQAIQLHVGYCRGIAPAIWILLLNGVRNGRGSYRGREGWETQPLTRFIIDSG